MSVIGQNLDEWHSQLTPSTVTESDASIHVSLLATPLGAMVACVADDRLCLLEFTDRPSLEKQFQKIAQTYARPFAAAPHAIIQQMQIELDQYFDGRRQRFTVPIELNGTTFQQSVWQHLLTIPYGETTTYHQIAASLGKPNAQRAVGSSNGLNRLAIIVPCHRVLRADGGLSGYAGHRWRKKRLLEIEGVAVRETAG